MNAPDGSNRWSRPEPWPLRSPRPWPGVWTNPTKAVAALTSTGAVGFSSDFSLGSDRTSFDTNPSPSLASGELEREEQENSSRRTASSHHGDLLWAIPNQPFQRAKDDRPITCHAV